MLQLLKRCLYDFITWTGILPHIMAFLEPVVMKMMKLKLKELGNHKVTDEGGATVNLTKYKGRVYPPFPPHLLDVVPGLTIREDDVMICGYPKTGCHWVYEIMYMLLRGKAKLSTYGKERGGMIEGQRAIMMDSLPSPRVLNTHLLYDELPLQTKERKTKIVLTVRSPKDTVVSFYHHVRGGSLFYGYYGTFGDYFKLYMAGKLDYGSYCDYLLSWDEVMKSQTDNPILLVEYEKLKKSPLQCVKEIARFLELSITDDFAEDILKACDFQKMKNKRKGTMVANLFRKGQTGDWRNWLTDEQNSEMEKVWKERMSGCIYQPEL